MERRVRGGEWEKENKREKEREQKRERDGEKRENKIKLVWWKKRDSKLNFKARERKNNNENDRKI